MTQNIAAAILHALYDQLANPEPACVLVRSVTRTVGIDNPALFEAVLDKLHLELPFPTEACAIVRGVQRDLIQPRLAA